MDNSRRNLLSQQINSLNEAAGLALDKVSAAPDFLSHLIDVGREKLNVLPPIQNYGSIPVADKSYYANQVEIGSQYDPRTVPPSLNYGKGSIFHGKLVPGTVTRNGSRAKSTPVPFVSGYRPDPTNRYGGGHGVETLPTKINAHRLYSLSRDMAAAKDFGVPQLSSTQIASLVLKEGRDDMGSNGQEVETPLLKSLLDSGMSYESAAILSQIKEKSDTAKRLGISFEKAWNGTGTNKYGQTGQDYANSVKQGLPAISNPQNSQLMSLLQSGLDAGTQYPLPRKK
jgi:hypothetical protein